MGGLSARGFVKPRRDGGLPRTLDTHVMCARADHNVVLETLPRLIEARVSPRVWAGVDEDPGLLGEVLAGTREPALFVICTSPRLSTSAIHRLVAMFARAQVPMQRLLVVALDPVRPHTLGATVGLAMEGWRRHLRRTAVMADATTGTMVDAACNDHSVESAANMLGHALFRAPAPPTTSAGAASRPRATSTEAVRSPSVLPWLFAGLIVISAGAQVVMVRCVPTVVSPGDPDRPG